MATETPSSPQSSASHNTGRRTFASASPARPQRLVFRLIGIPVLAIAGVLIYRGLDDRFFLPECGSTTAKNTLADVFKQLKVEPLHYGPITTVSIDRREVVCKAVLPLADGATLDVAYRFFWQGGTAQMKYSISRKEPQNSTINPAPLRTSRPFERSDLPYGMN